MKKNILFVMESLRIGGAEKSLVTLLSLLDEKKYNIDLFLFQHEGEFMKQIPSYVNLLPIDNKAALFQKNFKNAWIKYFLQGDFVRFFHSFLWLVKCVINRFVLHKEEYYGWNHQKYIYSKLHQEYDIAVGYLEKKSTYYTVDLVQAEKKYAYMHTDYDAIPHDEKIDDFFFNKLNGLAVVSEHTADTMKRHFPDITNKVFVIKNMVSADVIRKMALEPAAEMEKTDADTIKICTVGRLTIQKNIDGAIEILKGLIDAGIKAEWFVVGDGEEKMNLERLIQEYGLVGKFHLLGSRVNPYPYMKNADVYVQPSRWEGYGITVAEAKVLCKPIVVSDIPEFREQIEDRVNGIICKEINDYQNAIIEIIKNQDIRTIFKNNLSIADVYHQLEEIKKMERMF